jgi:hypothetical protein
MKIIITRFQAIYYGFIVFLYSALLLYKNYMVWVRERTIPTERPPLIGEAIANFLRIEGATWSAWRFPTAVFSVFQTGVATFCYFIPLQKKI